MILIYRNRLKNWSLGCVKRAPMARGCQEPGITQPRNHSSADPCTEVFHICPRSLRERRSCAGFTQPKRSPVGRPYILGLASLTRVMQADLSRPISSEECTTREKIWEKKNHDDFIAQALDLVSFRDWIKFFC